jgi:hypothetical protein
MMAERFESEARARLIWGDSQEQIIAHLQTQGATLVEAQTAYEAIKDDRAEYVRSAAKRKIIPGILLIAVPIVCFVIFMFMNVLPVRFFALTIVIGLIGAWKVIRGVLGVVRPEAIQGDLSEEGTE